MRRVYDALVELVVEFLESDLFRMIALMLALFGLFKLMEVLG